MSWIARAWGYSRTIFLNVVSFVTAMLAALVPIAMGMDWSTVLGGKWLLLWLLFMNALNVALRLITTAPVGEKE